MDASYLTGKESESCCAYNTEKLLAYLVSWGMEQSALDHLEGLKYNALLNSASAATGLSQYEQPMGRNKKKRFSSPYGDFWCCTGSGIETMAALQGNLWFRDGDAVFPNLFVSSDLDLDLGEKRARLSLRTDYPKNCVAEITITCEEDVPLTLKLKKHRVKNVRCSSGSCETDEQKGDGFVRVRGVFRDGDRIGFDVVSPVVREPLSPAAPEVRCTKFGPILLASVRRDEWKHPDGFLPVPPSTEDGKGFVPLYEVEDETYSVYEGPEVPAE